jgi:hypothetical protein
MSAYTGTVVLDKKRTRRKVNGPPSGAFIYGYFLIDKV